MESEYSALPRLSGLLLPIQANAYDLILAMNTLRVSYGLPALIEDPIVNAVAQWTAAIMAANNMSWHIGDVRGRLAAAGYGGGAHRVGNRKLCGQQRRHGHRRDHGGLGGCGPYAPGGRTRPTAM